MPREAIRLGFRTRMEAESPDGEIMLFGEIVQDYGKWYKENYPNDRSATDFDKAVKELRKNGVRNLNLRINSPGGIVYEAIAMRSILSGAGFEQVNIRIEGMCASAATLIATLPGATVEIAKGSTYMIHNPWTIAFGNANEMEMEIENLRQIEKTSRDMYALKTGQSDEQLKEWMDEEKWFTAEDAVSYGFCDQMAEDGVAAPAAACVTQQEMAVMRGIYRHIPENVQEEQEDTPMTPEALAEAAGKLLKDGSNANPVAGSATVINHEEDTQGMDIKELTVDQLREGNPALLESIRQDAAREALEQDQARRNDIDDLTMTGYEEMAENAKNTGMSAADFMKAVVKAQKEKGQKFISDRAQETAPAQQIAGGAPQDTEQNAEKEIENAAKEIAEYAKSYRGSENGGMY